MKKMVVQLEAPWYIRERKGEGPLSVDEMEDKPEYDWLESSSPAGVHEILLDHGKIKDPRDDNNCDSVKWIAERDWIYRYTFTESLTSKNQRLIFDSLDTWVDIYLNKEKIASSDNMFLPVLKNVPAINAGDILMLHFSSPQRMYDSIVVPPEWEGSVNRMNIIRKSKHDFTQFGGQNPYMALVGPCGEIRLEGWDDACLDYVDITTRVENTDGIANIKFVALGKADYFVVSVVDDEMESEVVTEKADMVQTLTLRIPMVKSWNPRGYGNPSIYRIKVKLYKNGEEIDSCEKIVGFRSCTIDENLNTVINGHRVRMWGACLTPLDGMTHMWDQSRFEKLLELAVNAHMNILRIWGGGFPLPDALYEACDRCGILIWQDFIHDYGMYPNSEEYIKIFLDEARTMVLRLKNHPCILLWCGGNETFLGAEYVMPERPFLGAELYTRYYRELCNDLDPGRYYHVNSPYGGAYTNDPSVGDTHSYGHDWYVPGLSYPVFPSENNRTSTPCLATMEKILGPNLWPEDFCDRWTRESHPLMPNTWKR
jgi:beta-galactosidase/beta-glucuronidase